MHSKSNSTNRTDTRGAHTFKIEPGKVAFYQPDPGVMGPLLIISSVGNTVIAYSCFKEMELEFGAADLCGAIQVARELKELSLAGEESVLFRNEKIQGRLDCLVHAVELGS